MKKIILSVVVLSIVFASQAQEIPERKSERPGMMERKKRHHGMEMKQLNLTEEQKAKFKSQNESFRKQMEELKKNDNITVKDWKSRAETIRKDHKASIGSILTSDQKAQLEKMKAEGKARHEGMAKQRSERLKTHGGAERMKTHLGLTDEQSAKMESNRKEIGQKMKAIREDKSLNDEQKKEQMKELHKKQKEMMKSILTDEQLQKMKESKRQRPGGDKKNPDKKQTI